MAEAANRCRFADARLDGDIYQSRCGNRFNWIPPHDLAKKKGLLV